jgi:hypothetical protein
MSGLPDLLARLRSVVLRALIRLLAAGDDPVNVAWRSGLKTGFRRGLKAKRGPHSIEHMRQVWPPAG